VSNWFTNVRKRIWQPIKKKNKNKGAHDLMLKVKLRLESDAASANSEIEKEVEPMDLLKNPQIHSELEMIASTFKELR
jgi:hypothetical protein